MTIQKLSFVLVMRIVIIRFKEIETPEKFNFEMEEIVQCQGNKKTMSSVIGSNKKCCKVCTKFVYKKF